MLECRPTMSWSYAIRTSSDEAKMPVNAFLLLALAVGALTERLLARHVVEAENDVLRRVDDRAPLAGDRMLLVDIISTRASICASSDSGTCTAIWSPSKSALKAVQTSGWSRIALPSMSTGSKAWMPSGAASAHG